MSQEQTEAATMMAAGISELFGLRTREADESAGQGSVLGSLAGAADKIMGGLWRYLGAGGEAGKEANMEALMAGGLPFTGLLQRIAVQEPDRLGHLNDRGLATFIAMVLARLDAGLAATILMGLPNTMQVQVATDLGQGPGEDATKVLTGILQHLDQSTRSTVVACIDRYVPELAERLRGCLFGFADVLRLDDAAIQHLLRHIDSQTLIRALHGSSPEIQDRLLSNISVKAASMIQEELADLGPVDEPATSKAQERIALIVWKLVEAGEISIASP